MRSKRVKEIEAAHGRPLRDLLIELYYEKGLELKEIAAELEVPEGTVPGWFTSLGITREKLARERAMTMLEDTRPAPVAKELTA